MAKFMRRVVFNQKGGVGKSSITANLAAISASRGIPTLVVDLDPQGNASQYLLGGAYEDAVSGVTDFFRDCLGFRILPEDPISYVTESGFEDLAVMASGPELAELEPKLAAKHKIYKLRDALVNLQDRFDAIYIDTPPAFNFYTLSALIAADRCLIPFDCDEFSRRALYRLLERVHEIQADHNENLTVEGIIVNNFQLRANLPKAIVSELTSEGLPVLKSHISHSVKIRESHQKAVPIVNLAPQHKVSQQFRTLYDEING